MTRSSTVFLLHHANIFEGASMQSGNIGALKRYLVKRKIPLVSVILPLPESPCKIRMIEDDGTYLSTKRIIKGPSFSYGPLLLLFDVFWLCAWLLRNKLRSTVWIGGDALTASIGLVFQRLHFTSFVVLFATDIVPQRFGNKLLDFAYRANYILATRKSNAVWCLSPSAEKLLSFFGRKQVKVIMGGPDADEIKPWVSTEYDRSKIVYLGYLDAYKGIDLLLKAFKAVVDQGIDVKLEIVGSGPMEDWVKREIQENGIEQRVKLHGFIKDYGEVIRIVSSCCLGVALYKPVPENYTYFADPGKVKEYLACGLPVLLTKVPEIWREIEACGAGVTVAWDVEAIAQVITTILSNPEKIESMRSSASHLSRRYSWTAAFDLAFPRML